MTDASEERITISGRVIPESRRLSLPCRRAIEFKDPDGLRINFDINVTDGAVSISCSVVNSTQNTLQRCIGRAHELTTSLVDSVAVVNGWHVSVVFDTYCQAGTVRQLAFGERGVCQIDEAISADDLDFLSSLMLGSLNFRLAIHDLVSSLGTFNYSAIAACRAVETIRNEMAQPGTPRDMMWIVMREKLNLSKDYIEYITNASRESRHGNRGATNGELQMEVTRRTWTILSRYIHYKKQKTDAPLSHSQFRTL